MPRIPDAFPSGTEGACSHGRECDVVGWQTGTLAESVPQARAEMPCYMPGDTLYTGSCA